MQNGLWPTIVDKKHSDKNICEFFEDLFSEDIFVMRQNTWMKTCITEGKNKEIILNIFENDDLVNSLITEFNLDLISRNEPKDPKRDWYGIEYIFTYPENGKILKRE